MKVGRKKYKEEDKKIGTSISISKDNFEKISESKTKKIMLLPEYIINGYDNKIINEKNPDVKNRN